MYDLIKQLTEVRGAIQSLERFVPTERNCNLILASIQRLDSVTAALSKMEERSRENERDTP